MPETRPYKAEIFLDMAALVSRRSTCKRLQVGCVLTDLQGELVTIGYNGTYRGGPNECLLDPSQAGGCGCVHAEVNALVKAPRGAKVAYTTHAPCHVCATLMVNAGVERVHYSNAYRSTEGVDLLRRAKVFVAQGFTPVEW